MKRYKVVCHTFQESSDGDYIGVGWTRKRIVAETFQVCNIGTLTFYGDDRLPIVVFAPESWISVSDEDQIAL